MSLKSIVCSTLILCSIQFITAQEYLRMINAGTYRVQEVIDSANVYFSTHGTGKGSGFKQFKRWEYNALRLMDVDGYIPTATEKLQAAMEYRQYIQQTVSNRQPMTDNWQEMGPLTWNPTTGWNPGIGRITGVSIEQTNPDHIIVGANTGGVWRTTNGGQDWTPLTDFYSNMRVYSVTIDPTNPNTYFFGSSNGLIFKSVDAGITWSLLNTIGNSLVNKIKIHPSNPDIMFACAENVGIYRTTDGGQNWSLLNITSKGYDVEFKPGDPSVVYVSNNRFYRSTDGGANFTVVSGIFGLEAPKMIGVSPDDPNVVYVVEAYQDGGDFRGFYKSTDSGVSFTEIDHGSTNFFGYSTSGNDTSGQAPRDMDIAVNPNDVNEVHIAGILTWRSFDGGNNFQCTSDWVYQNAIGANRGYCHADVDIMEFSGNTLFVGTDGGIFKAQNAAAPLSSTFYENITNAMGIRQFYKIGVSQTPDPVITGGSQDNGTSFHTVSNGWRDWLGADGMEGFIDKSNTNIMYGTIQFGRMYRTDNASVNIIDIVEPGPGGGNWVTPFEQDPSNPNTIYVGYNAVYRSTNKGSSWTQVSQGFPGDLHHMKVAPSNNQVIYASRNGLLFKTTDGGATNWQSISQPFSGNINFIAIHPEDPEKVAILKTNGSAMVLITEDGGVTWENFTLNLPNQNAALSAVWHDNGANGLYVGMESGIFYIDHTLSEWQPYNTNLPNTLVNELEINTQTGLLYAATYGRGLWVSPMVEPALTANCQNISITLDENGSATILPSDIDDHSVGQSFSIDVDTFSCDDIGTPVTVTLTVGDGNGNFTSCTALVTVVDETGPEISCPIDQTVLVDDSFVVPDYVILGEVTATDNCTLPVTEISQDPAPGTVLQPGLHVISFSAQDAFGNEALPCSFELTVEELLDNPQHAEVSDFKITPNPAADRLLLTFPDAVEGMIRIYDMAGKRVLEVAKSNISQTLEIPIDHLNSGTYFLQFNNDTLKVIKRFIKE